MLVNNQIIKYHFPYHLPIPLYINQKKLPYQSDTGKCASLARKGGRAQRAARPSAKGGSKGGKAVDRSPDRVVDGKGRAGSVESVDGE